MDLITAETSIRGVIEEAKKKLTPDEYYELLITVDLMTFAEKMEFHNIKK